jgi:hypothetical protein
MHDLPKQKFSCCRSKITVLPPHKDCPKEIPKVSKEIPNGEKRRLSSGNALKINTQLPEQADVVLLRILANVLSGYSVRREE